MTVDLSKFSDAEVLALNACVWSSQDFSCLHTGVRSVLDRISNALSVEMTARNIRDRDEGLLSEHTLDTYERGVWNDLQTEEGRRRWTGPGIQLALPKPKRELSERPFAEFSDDELKVAAAALDSQWWDDSVPVRT